MSKPAAVIDGEVEDPKVSKAVATKRKTDVAVAAPASESATVLSMLQTIMTDPTVSIERVNQAFEFYQRVDAAQAKKAFDAAMAAAKAEFEPIIKKRAVSFGKGDNKTEYKHEDLADISAAVDPILAAHGLNTRFRASSKINEPITVTCIVTHQQGYSEETTLSAGADGSGGKNSIQQLGSTLTYLQRYTKRLALGLAPARDDDGAKADAASEAFITEAQANEIRADLDTLKIDIEKFCWTLEVDGLAKIPVNKLAAANILINARRRAKT